MEPRAMEAPLSSFSPKSLEGLSSVEETDLRTLCTLLDLPYRTLDLSFAMLNTWLTTTLQMGLPTI